VSGRRLLASAVFIIALVLLLGRWTASLSADYYWYRSMDAAQVWRARMATTLVLTLASFLFAAGFAFLNLYAVRQSVVSLVLPRRIGNLEFGEEVNGRYLVGLVVALSVAIGIALAFPSDRWSQALLTRIGMSFGEADAYWTKDLGFFVYWLPFESAVHSWMVIVLSVVCVVVVLLYALTPSLKWERGALYVSAYVRRHLTVLGAVVLLMLAWSYRLDMYRMLLGGSGPGGLFTAVDREMLKVMLILAILTMCAAFVVAGAGWNGQVRLAFATVTAVLLMSLVGRTVAPLILSRSNGADSELNAYRRTHNAYTQRAFAVDNEHFTIDTIGPGFTSAGEVIDRLAVWDGATLARATERIRHVRTFGTGAGWTSGADGVIAHVVERGTESSPEVRDVWSVARFAPAGADEHGQPLRVNGGNDDVYIAEPIVFDSAPSYSVLSNSARQIIGVEMQSTRSRLLHAWALQNFRLLWGELPGDSPLLVERRDVRDRIEALVPFFDQGSEIVPVVANDSLYWIIELYSSSQSYPLGQRFTINGQERSYFHHAATAIVHAHSGGVRFLLTSYPDPIALSWAKQFPNLFIRRLDRLPSAIVAALPPLTDGTRAQALAYASAGAPPAGGGYERRHFAILDGADSTIAREPIRAVLPGFGGVSALWVLLDSADRMRGVMAAPGGALRTSVWIPVASDQKRWANVLDRFRAADTTHETSVSRGPMRAVPVGGKPFYVQASFSARPGSTPTLASVMTLQDDSLRSGRTLAAALGGREPVVKPAQGPPPDLRTRADSLYRTMREALARGDWPTFGHAFDALGILLRGTPR
jgi:uncharacterized membrane protein (UPF0182 family)